MSPQNAKSIFVALTISLLTVFIMIPTTSGSAGSPEGADATYKAKCASCHSLDGSGSGPMGKKMNIRDLRSADVQKQTDAQLLTVISKGKGKMPGFDKTIGADSCKQLVTFIRELAKKK